MNFVCICDASYQQRTQFRIHTVMTLIAHDISDKVSQKVQDAVDKERYVDKMALEDQVSTLTIGTPSSLPCLTVVDGIVNLYGYCA